jgi:hypothetical protein
VNYSKGISWFDDCRIPFVDENEMEGVCKSDKTKKTYNQQWGNTIYNYKRTGGNSNGRYPANLLCSDDVLNDGSISNGKVGMTQQASPNEIYGKFNSKKDTKINDGITDKGSNSRYYDIDAWFNNLINNI